MKQSNPGTVDIDGTTRVNLAGLIDTSMIAVDFDSPITAFGFDTDNYDISDDASSVFVNGQSVGTFPGMNQEAGFVLRRFARATPY